MNRVKAGDAWARVSTKRYGSRLDGNEARIEPPSLSSSTRSPSSRSPTSPGPVDPTRRITRTLLLTFDYPRVTSQREQCSTPRTRLIKSSRFRRAVVRLDGADFSRERDHAYVTGIPRKGSARIRVERGNLRASAKSAAGGNGLRGNIPEISIDGSRNADRGSVEGRSEFSRTRVERASSASGRKNPRFV